MLINSFKFYCCLRRTAKEKSAEIEVVEKQLDAKLLELKNMQQ